MDALQLKKAYTLEVQHLPNAMGTVAVIESFDTEYYDARENGQKVEKERHLMYLRGCKLPLKLNNTRIDILMGMFGRDTDGWIGRKVGLFAGVAQHYGESKPAILLHMQPLDNAEPTPWPQALAASTRPRFAPGAAAPGATAMTFGAPQGATQASPRDMRPFGPSNAKKLLAALAEQGTNTDALLRWMNGIDHEAWQSMNGRPLEDYPHWVAPLCQRFLREYVQPTPTPAITPAPHAPHAPVHGPATPSERAEPNFSPTKPAPVMNPPIPEDDIPF